MKSHLKVFIFFVFVFSAQFAQAFPEMIKHGYVNCTACHVAPSGGGVLNAYGRSLSAELMSTWSYKNEEKFLHGLVDTSGVDEWLVLGGDYRGVQFHTEYESNDGTKTTTGRWINMQASLELGVVQERWAAVISFGQFNFEDRNHRNRILFTPSRYYGMYKPTDELSIRAGRFQPIFGVNLPDHILSTRAFVGIGTLTANRGFRLEDKHTVEAAWLAQDFNLTASYYEVGREVDFDDVSLTFQKSETNDKGQTLTGQYIFNDTLKVGPQILIEEGDTVKRNVIGVSGHLGWNEKWATLVDINQLNSESKTGAREDEGYAMLQRTSYEVFKGFNLLYLNDYYQNKVSNVANLNALTKIYRQGPGVIWLPRPHFDLQLFVTQERSSFRDKPGIYAWLMTHYYF